MRISKISANDEDGNHYDVTVDYFDLEENLTLTLSIESEEKLTTVDILFHELDGSIKIANLSLSITGFAGCLAASGAGHLVQVILECRKKGFKTKRALIKCLKKKGFSINAALAGIAVACLANL